jgi:hypothetical protein
MKFTLWRGESGKEEFVDSEASARVRRLRRWDWARLIFFVASMIAVMRPDGWIVRHYGENAGLCAVFVLGGLFALAQWLFNRCPACHRYIDRKGIPNRCQYCGAIFQ